jgi:hypothetical protein
MISLVTRDPSSLAAAIPAQRSCPDEDVRDEKASSKICLNRAGKLRDLRRN